MDRIDTSREMRPTRKSAYSQSVEVALANTAGRARRARRFGGEGCCAQEESAFERRHQAMSALAAEAEAVEVKREGKRSNETAEALMAVATRLSESRG